MEQFQQDHIRDNLHELIRNTNCSIVLFIAYLRSKNVLEEDEKQLCTKDTDTVYQQAAKFYDIIVTKRNSYDILRDALRETYQTGALYILDQIGKTPRPSTSAAQSLPDLESRIRKRIRYEVRPPVPLFTGREAEIALLHEHMTSQENGSGLPTIVTQTASVTGLGGIGKSELCRKYIELYSDTHYEGNVIWIQAEREADMTRDFRTVAQDHLKISLKNKDGSEKNIKTIVDEVYNYFNKKKVLFVFDNAVSSDDEHLDIFLPTRVTTKPAIIITSRDRDFQEMPSELLIIGELKEEEAVEFVKKGLNIQDNCQDEIIQKLVKRLQYFPLAIQQAVSFIKNRRKLNKPEIAEYLSLFETHTGKLLDSKVTRLSTNNYSRTTYTTWKITTDLIASDEEFGKLSLKCLYIMSYFQSERIPMQFFHKCGEISSVSVFEVESALQLLVKYSMINSQPTEKMLNVHRLVQEVTRIDLKADGKEQFLLSFCLCLFNLGVNEETVSHAKSVVEFSIPNPSILKQYPLVPCLVGETMMHMGSTECASFCEKCHNILSGVLPEGAVELIHLEYFLTRGLIKVNTYEQCLEALYEVLGKYMSVEAFNEDMKFYVWYTKVAIVQTLKYLKRYDEGCKIAATLFTQKIDFPTGQHTRTSKENAEIVFVADLAFGLHLNQKNYKEALVWCGTMLAFFHCEVLPTCNVDILAENEREVRYIEEIWKGVSKLIELDEKCSSFGETLADHLSDMGNKDSLRLSKTIYEFFKKMYGEENSKVLRQLVRIGLCFVKMNEYQEAVTIFRKPGVAAMAENEDFEIVLQTKQSVSSAFAMALSETGAYEEARILLVKTLDSFTKRFGEENEYVYRVLFQLSALYTSMDNFEEALNYFVKTEKIAAKLENFDPNTLNKVRQIIRQLSLKVLKI